jgi:hypothetical protein
MDDGCRDANKSIAAAAASTLDAEKSSGSAAANNAASASDLTWKPVHKGRRKNAKPTQDNTTKTPVVSPQTTTTTSTGQDQAPVSSNMVDIQVESDDDGSDDDSDDNDSSNMEATPPENQASSSEISTTPTDQASHNSNFTLAPERTTKRPNLGPRIEENQDHVDVRLRGREKWLRKEDTSLRKDRDRTPPPTAGKVDRKSKNTTGSAQQKQYCRTTEVCRRFYLPRPPSTGETGPPTTLTTTIPTTILTTPTTMSSAPLL